MGMMDKLAFWKSSDDFEEDKMPAREAFGLNDKPDDLSDPFNEPKQQEALGLHPDFNPERNFQTKEIPQQQTQSTFNGELISKDIEIVSTKIDALKSEIESMNQRLMNIESLARKEQDPRRYPPQRW